jgi:hypothetical protein
MGEVVRATIRYLHIYGSRVTPGVMIIGMFSRRSGVKPLQSAGFDIH